MKTIKKLYKKMSKNNNNIKYCLKINNNYNSINNNKKISHNKYKLKKRKNLNEKSASNVKASI